MTNRAKCLLYKFYTFLVYAVPMIILLIVKRHVYFKDGSAIGFFGVVIIAFVIISFKNTVLSFFKKNMLLTVSIALLITSILMLLFSKEMILICSVSALGSVVQYFITGVADVYESYSWVVIDGVRRRNPRRAIPDRQAWAEAYGVYSEDD